MISYRMSKQVSRMTKTLSITKTHKHDSHDYQIFTMLNELNNSFPKNATATKIIGLLWLWKGKGKAKT